MADPLYRIGELARLTGVPAPSLEMVHALIDLLTRGC